MVLSAPAGASLTLVIVKPIVLADASRLAFGGVLLPLSCTWKVKLVAAVLLAAGVNLSRPPVISLTGMSTPRPDVTAAPLLARVPLAGGKTRTAASVCCGTELGDG